MVYLGDMSVQLSRIRNYAVVVGLCIAASFVASPSEAKEMNVQNNCVSALTAKIYDEKDFSVLVPVASLNKIPNGRRLSARGLSSGKKYKIHLSGTCSSGTKVTLSGGPLPALPVRAMENWMLGSMMLTPMPLSCAIIRTHMEVATHSTR